MLYLGEGVREVMVDDDRAMQLFPDFSDPRQFYYLPNFPRIALMPDGSPAIRLIVFREDLDTLPDGSEDAVGILSLDVDLRWEPQDVAEAASRIRLEDDLEGEPRLTPVLFRSGHVRLMLLDAATPEDREEDVEATDFVVQVLGTGSPSLYGDNRAIFQSRLTKKGVAAISGSLDGMLPIGVVYDLTFAGLQPAFRVQANVDWTRIHEHFSTRRNTNVLFYEKDVREIIDTFEEDKIIDIDVTVEGVGAEAMDSDREAVMQSVRQLIFDKFFEATITPLDPAGGGTAGDVTDVLRTIGQDGVTMGMGYSYMQKDVTLEEVRTLDIDWSARRATERTIYPQAHLHTLVEGGGLTIDDLRTVVDADALFEQVPLEIVVHAPWQQDGVASVTVDAGYQDPATGQSRMFTESLDATKTSVTRRDWADRTNGADFWYRYEVVFLDGEVPGPTLKLRSGSQESPWTHHTDGTVVTITPQELYERHEIEIMAVQNFPFDRWPAVKASVRHRADDGSFTHQADQLLVSGTPSFTSRFRTDVGVAGTTAVKLEFSGATGEHVETDWAPMDDSTLVVTDPHGEDLNIHVLVSDHRDNVDNLVVGLRYSDDENGVHEDTTLVFSADSVATPQEWTVNLADPTRRRFEYQVTLIRKAGARIQTDWIETDTAVLALGEESLRVMRVEVVAEPFDDDLGKVEVLLRYEDAANDVQEEKTISLVGAGSQLWELTLVDATRRSYEATTTWTTTTGFKKVAGPVTRTASRLVVPGTVPGSD